MPDFETKEIMKKIVALAIAVAFSQNAFSTEKETTQITIQQVEPGEPAVTWTGRALVGEPFALEQTKTIKYQAKCKVTDPNVIIPPGELTTGMSARVRPLQKLDKGYLVHIAFQYTELVQMRIEKVRDCDIELPISNTLGLPSQTVLIAPGEKYTIPYRKQNGQPIEFKFSVE